MIDGTNALVVAAHIGDERLLRYVIGHERDPQGTFELSSDQWDLGPYISQRTRSPGAYRVGFRQMRSWLRPYAKWYVHQRIVLTGRGLAGAQQVVAALVRSDRWITAAGVDLIDLGSSDVFDRLWQDLLGEWDGPPSERPRRVAWRQVVSRPFWKAVSTTFGSPQRVPPVVPFVKKSIAVAAADDTKLIPVPVVKQIMNRLALHRDDVERLSARDEIRLCVLVLHIVLGRRISEVLSAPRGDGPGGPLLDYVATDGQPALGFRFVGSKGGGMDTVVYISSEWEDITRYCVTRILEHSDRARPLATSADSRLFILTITGRANSGTDGATGGRGQRAARLNYNSFVRWINGRPDRPREATGAMTRWSVTEDGAPDGPIHDFKTHAARHTRASVLTSDPKVSRLAAARDLNDRSTEIVSTYQHGVAVQNDTLRRRAAAGELWGRGAAWVKAIDTGGFEAGTPMLISDQPRVAALIRNSPAFVEFNRVETGYCVRPQGPAACSEYLLCVETADDGCGWFATDPADERCRGELDDRAATQRAKADEAALAGRVVLTGKLAVLAERAERMRDEVATVDGEGALARLRAFTNHKAGS